MLHSHKLNALEGFKSHKHLSINTLKYLYGGDEEIKDLSFKKCLIHASSSMDILYLHPTS